MVAAVAVRVADRADEPHAPSAPVESIQQSFTLQFAVVQGQQGAQRPFNSVHRLLRWDKVVKGKPSRLPQGHQLDEAHVPFPLKSETGQAYHILLVVIPHNDCVQFDRPQASAICSFDARPHFVYHVETSQSRQMNLVKAVDVDVHATQPRLCQGVGEPRQSYAVGGHEQLAHARHSCQAFHDLHNVAAQGGFTARQSQFVESQRDRCLGQLLNLERCQQVLTRHKTTLLYRHTVSAPQIAAVSD